MPSIAKPKGSSRVDVHSQALEKDFGLSDHMIMYDMVQILLAVTINPS